MAAGAQRMQPISRLGRGAGEARRIRIALLETSAIA
jgi:hypothetical protein